MPEQFIFLSFNGKCKSKRVKDKNVYFHQPVPEKSKYILKLTILDTDWLMANYQLVELLISFKVILNPKWIIVCVLHNH
jgi:hypothetical protein